MGNMYYEQSIVKLAWWWPVNAETYTEIKEIYIIVNSILYCVHGTATPIQTIVSTAFNYQ